MSEIKNVIIIGAGGNLGPSVLNEFLKSSFNVTVLSREGSSSTFPSGVKVVHADYSSVDSLTSAFKGQDAVLSLVGTLGFAEQVKLIDAAIAAGVKRFLPSEYGSNTQDQRVQDQVPIFAPKVNTVKYLRSKEDQISWSSIITGPFFDWCLKVGFLGFDASSKTATLIDDGKATISSTNLQQVGRAAVKVLERADLTKNQYIFVSSFETTQREILEVAEKITGEKWTINNVSSKDLLEGGGAKIQKGDFSGAFDLIKGSCFSKEGLGNLKPVGLWNEKLGLPKEDFEESIKAGLTGKLVGQ
ncbi:isoflavone reductase family protein [Lentithecium fluviatile CBS 122367]|uniref:Isoflavone reductase family protein n=1 Tax=Lentithecium fluviatile CBS 122367 TaxID=1168545 RepID=A0A6G1JG21_9PLEO|nr:isoflavone reductase family protein [Lentithecium fluviatile CBS 122367]